VIVRIWRTGVDPDRVVEYETFAADESLPMFRKQSGFQGVLFLRTGGHASVITLWDDMHAVERLADSPTYFETVKRIANSGMLVGDQVIEVFEAHGLHVEPGVFER
jgi:heme-degrading monooxygenase HmoA